jgi:hypothetical protein
MRDALDVPQPYPEPRRTITMNIDEERQIGTILFDVLWSFIRPKEKTANLMLASQASNLVKLADKYDVSGPVHTVYTLLIMQAEDRGYLKNVQPAALAYAANSRDPWLCYYVVSRLQMGDPANWQRCTIDHLGSEFWYSLVQAYPRPAHPAKDQESQWTKAAGEVQWKKLLQK